jgi:hypothetical protein
MSALPPDKPTLIGRLYDVGFGQERLLICGFVPCRNCFIDPGDAEFFAKSDLVEPTVEVRMQNDPPELDQMQSAYKAAVEEWIAAIRQEEALASVNHSISEVDKWEGAHFREDEIRSKVKAAKKQYEDALRMKFFHF